MPLPSAAAADAEAVAEEAAVVAVRLSIRSFAVVPMAS